MPDQPDPHQRAQANLCDGCMQPRRRCRCEEDDRQRPNDMSADNWRDFYDSHPDYDIADDLEP